MPTRKDAATPSRRRLGKGLGSLMSARPVEVAPPPEPHSPSAPPDAPSGPGQIPIHDIHANPVQPRKDFDEQALEALADSIRSAGIMQPVIVRPRAAGGYELVAGERRWRAAQRAGLEAMPAIVRQADDRQVAEWSLIENLQREDLNPIERADAFRRLSDEFGMTHQEVGQVVGLDRSSVTNHLRLLDLDDQIQDVVRLGLLSLGHARTLLSLRDPDLRRRVALKAAREGWSVRATEREVNRLSKREDGGSDGPTRSINTRRAHLADIERRLSEHLGTKVGIRPGKKKGSGSLVVSFYDGAQFEGLMERFGFPVDSD